ncbi:MAG: hypothetical protein RJQ04_05655, partial [Longimicrobiales bacterium]
MPRLLRRPPIPPWPALGFAVVLPWVAACTEGAAPHVTAADSAGVRVTLSAPLDASFGSVDSIPLLSLGGPDAVGPELFGNVQGARIDRGGTLWVVDGQSAEVRRFGLDGTHRSTVGGRGEGPGEFMRPRLLGSFAGDSTAVWDDPQGRLTVFDADGAMARSRTVTGGDGPPPNGFRTFPDGTVLARLRTVLPAGALEPGSVIPDTAVFARVDYGTMAVDTLGGAPAPRWVWTGRNSIPVPFRLNPGFDVQGDEVHVTSGPAFRIRVLRDGRLVESYGLDLEPAPVTARARQDYTDLFGADPSVGSEYVQALDHPETPDLLPAYRSVVAGPGGEIWAERYEYGTFDVFGPDRAYRGRISVPLSLTQVLDTALVGVWRDDLGVEHVRVYRLRR